jgi:hypothetical protein
VAASLEDAAKSRAASMSSQHEDRKGTGMAAIPNHRCMDHLPPGGDDPVAMTAPLDPAVDLCCLAAQIRVSHLDWSHREFEIIARALDRAAKRIWTLEDELQRATTKQQQLPLTEPEVIYGDTDKANSNPA